MGIMDFMDFKEKYFKYKTKYDHLGGKVSVLKKMRKEDIVNLEKDRVLYNNLKDEDIWRSKELKEIIDENNNLLELYKTSLKLLNNRFPSPIKQIKIKKKIAEVEHNYFDLLETRTKIWEQKIDEYTLEYKYILQYLEGLTNLYNVRYGEITYIQFKKNVINTTHT